ncbi:MAG: hypothetical protein ACP5PA_00595 [Elusimicrobiales bacterium]
MNTETFGRSEIKKDAKWISCTILNFIRRGFMLELKLYIEIFADNTLDKMDIAKQFFASMEEDNSH